jgi:hypothetical protein
MALSQPVTEALSEAGPAQLRRCWYRRLTRVDAGRTSVYDVECLLPKHLGSVPLGDLETARPVCNTCVAAGVFRPDEE